VKSLNKVAKKRCENVVKVRNGRYKAVNCDIYGRKGHFLEEKADFPPKRKTKMEDDD
jgi:hypothetical protein